MDEIKRMYLDYVNNFLTVAAFAEYYKISEHRAMRIIIAGRWLAERQ